jgi:hypothetical protein
MTKPKASLVLVIASATVLHAAGCGGSSESYQDRQAALAKSQAASSIVVSKQEPPSSCRNIGVVEGKDPKMYAPFASMGANSEDAMINLREKALEKGGNYVVLDMAFGPMAQGRLFACPPGAAEAVAQAPAAAPAAALPPSSASACKPDCSPGFACVDAQCVSACNPACAAGKQCGADRICH